jgi:glycosyltransferase involved in cell wall biosynthesis
VLQEALAFVLPSYQENLGVAVLEAIAAGLPVIISPDVQVKSFVEANNLGHVVPREKKALASALVSILEDTSLRRRVADRGPEAVRETFSVDVVGTQLTEMYADVTGIGGVQAPST